MLIDYLKCSGVWIFFESLTHNSGLKGWDQQRLDALPIQRQDAVDGFDILGAGCSYSHVAHEYCG